jgi:hypothetical protein
MFWLLTSYCYPLFWNFNGQVRNMHRRHLTAGIAELMARTSYFFSQTNRCQCGSHTYTICALNGHISCVSLSEGRLEKHAVAVSFLDRCKLLGTLSFYWSVKRNRNHVRYINGCLYMYILHPLKYYRNVHTHTLTRARALACVWILRLFAGFNWEIHLNFVRCVQLYSGISLCDTHRWHWSHAANFQYRPAYVYTYTRRSVLLPILQASIQCTTRCTKCFMFSVSVW